tara:strand:- start:618 stop:1622 length:1005 start_codon:yes stop_codon:yes gene_type:complete
MTFVNKTPIWFMRQAGRYLPEYMEIRSKNSDFLKLCFTPDLASEISLQPIKRFDLDFIILFSDILVIPHALGQEVKFLKNHGPLLNPISSIKDLNHTSLNKSLNKISNIFETVKILHTKKNKKNLIGFCGGPFTVLNYMIEGGTSKTHNKIKTFVKNRKEEANDIIKVITEISVEYLKKQIESGANYIQIFESWAGLLERDEYIDFIIKPNQKISEEIKAFSKQTKIIHFPRGSRDRYKIFAEEVNCDVLSLDQTYPKKLPSILREKGIIVQGNLDPQELLEDGERIEEKTKEVLEKFKNNNHIFNLSHGILPKTKISNIEKVIKIVREHETPK